MTPLDPFRDGIWLKREDEHQLGAFKWRGALATLEARRPDVVVTASTGNHGEATAWAARRTRTRAVVFVPRQAIPWEAPVTITVFFLFMLVDVLTVIL